VKKIILIGFMGAGKTTVGSLLAQRLCCNFIDLDEEIVKFECCSINDIFQRKGESAFRICESDALKRVSTDSCFVLSTGGGIIGSSHNWTLMREKGTIIYLHCDWDVLQLRLKSSTARPLVNQGDADRLHQLYLSRLPLYQQADFIVDANGLSPDQIVTQILSLTE